MEMTPRTALLLLEPLVLVTVVLLRAKKVDKVGEVDESEEGKESNEVLMR
jgi:hypothetical protein